MVRKKNARAEDGAEGAKKAAVSLLAYKENTERELTDKLLLRGYNREEAAAAVEYVKSKRYLDEERYYRRLVENAANTQLYGKKHIEQLLWKKHFSRETIEKCADVYESVDFEGNCLRALENIYRGDMKKTAMALLRRGFSGAEVRYAVEKYEREHEN